MTWAAHRPAELYKEEFDKMASWKWKAVHLLTGRRCFYVERICLVSYRWEDKETPSLSWEGGLWRSSGSIGSRKVQVGRRRRRQVVHQSSMCDSIMRNPVHVC